MKKNRLLVIFLLLFVVSCTKENTADANQPLDGGKRESRVVPVERALDELNQLLASIGDETRSAKRTDIVSVEVVPESNYSATRAGGGTDTLLYIINFADSAGYALMGADIANEGLLALIDEGNLSAKEYSALVNNKADLSPEDELPAYVLSAVGSFPGKNLHVNHLPTDFSDLGGAIILSCAPWELEEQLNPLMRTKWGQREPYNYFCPGEGPCPAGCVAIALAQIMAFQNLIRGLGPSDFCGCEIDWNTIRAEIRVNAKEKYTKDIPLTKEALAIAWLIRGIGLKVDTDYSEDNSSSNIRKAKRCLDYSGYPNPRIQDYDFDYVLGMVRDRLSPVFVRGEGEATNGDRSGHAWVIDGYRIYRRYIMAEQWIYDREYIKMVHCNFGWNGRCDGYYVSDVFDLRQGAPVPDLDGDSTGVDVVGYTDKKLLTY